ncbi:MAG: TldD/PmbA family protein [Candidatus Hodarchaeales archaeon]|jgi:TldD protein
MDFDVSRVKERLEKKTHGKIGYSDLRVQENKSQVIHVQNYDVHVENYSISGHGLRVLNDGKWGFISSTGTFLELDDLDRKFDLASKLSQMKLIKSFDHERIELAPLNQIYETSVTFPEKQARFSRTDEVIELGEAVIDHFYVAGKRKLDLIITTNIDSKIFISSEGSVIKQKKIYHTVNFLAGVLESGKEYNGAGTSGQLGFVSKDNFDELVMKAQEVLTSTEDLIKAKSVKSVETLSLVFNPSTTWYLFHETVGHAVEADTLISGPSPFKSSIGNLVSRFPITVVDDPSLPNSVGSIQFDDDGLKASGTVIIEDGLLVELLHSRETAGALNSRSTGNSRAQDYSCVPLVRMNNFFIEPSDWSIEEILDFNGLYIVKCGPGLAQPQTGEFRLPVELAYRVNHGEVTETIRDFHIKGQMLDILDKIDAIGSETENNAVTCSKERQIVPQGSICPHIRINDCLIF